jgi:hypothetical protein
MSRSSKSVKKAAIFKNSGDQMNLQIPNDTSH